MLDGSDVRFYSDKNNLKNSPTKIAFLVLAHADPQHLGRLTEVLSGDDDVYVHIDAKVKDLDAFKKLSKFENVYFVTDRVKVAWAGISMIDATNILIKAALKNKARYSHLCLLSGSCFPLQPVNKLRLFIQSKPKHEFIRYIDMRHSPSHYMRQINQRWFKEPFWVGGRTIGFLDKIARKLLNLCRLKNDFNKQIVPYYGSQFFALSVECAEYVLNYQIDNPWFYEINRYTFAPDEHYFHTIIGNSVFNSNTDGVQPFLGRGVWRLANFHMVDPSLRKWFTINDWNEIKSSKMYFIRKVRTVDENGLINKIKSNW